MNQSFCYLLIIITGCLIKIRLTANECHKNKVKVMVDLFFKLVLKIGCTSHQYKIKVLNPIL